MIALLMALTAALTPAPPAPPEVTPPDYAEVWAWCGDRYPANPELADACRWGAAEMSPATQPTTEWRA